MYRQVGNVGYRNGFAELGHDSVTIAQSGQLDALVALEHIGARLSFSRNDEIYAEGDGSDSWYKVVSGTVRICKLLADGRRHIAEFCFSGDCFGIDSTSERPYSAEAVDDVIRDALPAQSNRAADRPEPRAGASSARDDRCAISPARMVARCCSAE